LSMAHFMAVLLWLAPEGPINCGRGVLSTAANPKAGH
jgi:hypothetical protein